MNTTPSFQFNEFQHIGVDFNSPEQVAQFDRKQGTSVEKDNALLDRLGVTAGHVLADLGCGTGHFACQAARRGAVVHAVDVSSAMLDAGRRRANELGLRNIHFHHAGFLTYEHAGPQADFVTTKSALHHLPDFWKAAALLRIHRWLRVGGTLYLWDGIFSFPPDQYAERCQKWIDTFGTDDPAGFSKAEFAAHIREEHSTYDWIMDAILLKCGFDIEKKNLPRETTAEYFCRNTRPTLVD